MSRIGKKIIELNDKTKVDYNKESRLLTVTGPLGSLKMVINSLVELDILEKTIEVKIEDPEQKEQRSMWGTTRALIGNMVNGVNEPFKKEIDLSGVGFKMELGKQLVLHIGFSHPVNVDIPEGVKLNLNKNTLTGESIDKQLIGDFFTKIHNMKPADIYKHKGFKFPGRYYPKKVGKKGK